MSQTITKTYTVYSYDELSDEAKEKARLELYDINVDFDWWEYDGHTGFSMDEIKKFHLNAYKSESDDLLKFKKMYFDIDRGGHVQFIDCSFSNNELARKFLGITPRLWEKIDISFNNSGRNTNTYLEIEWNDWDSEQTEHDEILIERAKERFDNKMEEALKNLRDQYDYLMSKEAIEDTIKANEYTFDENGYRKN